MNFDRPPAPAAQPDAAPVLAELIRELHSLRGAAGLLIVAQAAMQAVAGALAVGLAVNLYGHWASPVRWALFAFGLLFAALIRLGVVAWDGYRNRTMDMAESITRIDLNGDGKIAAPRRLKIDVMHRSENGSLESGQYDVLPDMTETQVYELAAGLLAGRPFSEREWTTGDGKLFTQGQFSTLQRSFVARGWAASANPGIPNAAIQLTVAGRAAMRRIAEEVGALDGLPYPGSALEVSE